MAKKSKKTKNSSSRKHHKKKSHTALVLIIIGIVIIIFIASMFLFNKKGESYSQDQIDTLAKCLTEKNTVMYGAFWCPHCARTKARFGSSFQYIHYVECDPRGDNQQAELCISKGIEKYDTWEFADSQRVVGEPSFETLSKMSGCSIGRN